MDQPINSPAKRRRRPNKGLGPYRDAIELGGATPVITKPIAKDSEKIGDDEADVGKEARERIFRKIKKLLAKRRRRNSRIILKPRLRADTTAPLTEEQAERLDHCKQAVTELNETLGPIYRAKSQRILRVMRTIRNSREQGSPRN